PGGGLPQARVWRSASASFEDVQVQLRPLMEPDLPGYLAAELPLDGNGQGGLLVEFRLRSGWDDGIPSATGLVHRLGANKHTYLMPGVGPGSVWHAAQTGAGGGLATPGRLGTGVGLSGLAVGTNADGRFEVYATDAKGWVWHAWQSAPNGGWGDWQRL